MSPSTKKKEIMSLPATAIPASVFRSSLWEALVKKDSALMHRPYHVAASAESWMKESLCSAAETFCSLPLGAEVLSWCLTFPKLWLVKFPWERTLELKKLPTEGHSWVISSVRSHLRSTSRPCSIWKTEVHKILVHFTSSTSTWPHLWLGPFSSCLGL